MCHPPRWIWQSSSHRWCFNQCPTSHHKVSGQYYHQFGILVRWFIPSWWRFSNILHNLHKHFKGFSGFVQSPYLWFSVQWWDHHIGRGPLDSVGAQITLAHRLYSVGHNVEDLHESLSPSSKVYSPFDHSLPVLRRHLGWLVHSFSRSMQH